MELEGVLIGPCRLLGLKNGGNDQFDLKIVH